ncbi:O-antigen ligase family protein [Mucilaginibacter pedocola]|uniref:O-antigen ligase-related domain-containing protein n=1 Tax=Mucilaginibacter pedocola TaxID=1792845 RepID=A0A1S9P8H4_9SPHI|nr:O-antigen ligase family protein [Mucilaginibacter pedocola]OOQ57276.1 hypothetical protein BC343_14260 [Mucilaginibacter pedocola]
MPATSKKLFTVADSPANQLSFYHLALLLLSLPYDRFYSHLILISFLLHTLVNLRKGEIKPVFTLSNLALASVFFVTVAGTLYSSNKPMAFNEWAKQITLLLFPLALCLNPIDLKKYRDKLLYIFAIGSAVTILYLYLEALRTIRFYHLPLSALVSADFTNHNFSGPLDIHATFFSMQIAVALVFLISQLVKGNGSKILNIVCCAILSVGIIQLASKSVFIALLIIINICLPYFLLKGTARWRFAAITVSLSVLVFAGIYSLGNFKERYINDLKTDLSKAKADELFDPRLARWQVALKLVGQAPIIGHGSGTEVGLLKQRFFEARFYRSYLAGLNAHNQYISFLIKTGIIGLLVYLATLYFGFGRALRRRDVLLLAFMVIVATVSFSENFLDVDKGIFFYAVFFSLFLFSEKEDTLSTTDK